MDTGWMKEHIKFEESLKVGDVVELRWTNSYRYYTAKARLTKVNQASVRGELLDEILVSRYGEPYLAYNKGRVISVPRFTLTTISGGWSANNGVFPVKEG